MHGTLFTNLIWPLRSFSRSEHVQHSWSCVHCNCSISFCVHSLFSQICHRYLYLGYLLAASSCCSLLYLFRHRSRKHHDWAGVSQYLQNTFQVSNLSICWQYLGLANHSPRRIFKLIYPVLRCIYIAGRFPTVANILMRV